MVVENGYKQTEIGLFPQDWDLINVDKIFTFYSTSNYSKAQMTLAGEVGCIHYGLIHAIPNSTYDVQDGIKYFISQEQARYEFIKNGDIVMVDASEDMEGVNKSVELFGIENVKYIAGLHTFLLRDTNSILANNFRGAILNSRIIKNQLLRLAVGMKVFGVSKPQLKTVLIPVPPLPEQTAIATALSDMDELIAQTEKLIEKKKAIKQGVMQELLRPKEGWVTKKLGDIFKISSSSSKSNYIVDSGKFVIMDMGSVSSNGAIIKTKKTDNNCDLLSFGDLVMPKDDIGGGYIIGKVGFIDKNDYYVLGDHVYKLLAIDSTIDTHFFYYLINSFYVNKHLRSKASGSAQLGLGRKAVLEQELIFPESRIKQISISETLADMDKEILVLELQNHKLKLQKQGMMQALLTGKIRLI